MIIRELDSHSQLLLLWVQNLNDLRDGPCIKCWDNAAARRQKLQLECLQRNKGHSSEKAAGLGQRCQQVRS